MEEQEEEEEEEEEDDDDDDDICKKKVRDLGISCVRRQSIKKPNFWNSEPASAHSTLAMVALRSGDFKLYSDASSITPCQLVIELDALEWVRV